MSNKVGYRAKLAVIVPSTNTVVEHDYAMMAPAGVTIHVGRSYITEPDLQGDDDFEALLEAIDRGIENGMRDVMTSKPDHMIMGMSVETFWDGLEGNRKFEERMRNMCGLNVTAGASATAEALRKVGAKNIAFLSPYQPIGDEHVAKFYNESGFNVVRYKGLRAESATAMAAIDEATLVKTLKELDGPDVDAIVQVGTNLSMVRLADAAERWLQKPVIAINTACMWHALRANGINDKLDGFGSLLRDY